MDSTCSRQRSPHPHSPRSPPDPQTRRCQRQTDSVKAVAPDYKSHSGYSTYSAREKPQTHPSSHWRFAPFARPQSPRSTHLANDGRSTPDNDATWPHSNLPQNGDSKRRSSLGRDYSDSRHGKRDPYPRRSPYPPHSPYRHQPVADARNSSHSNSVYRLSTGQPASRQPRLPSHSSPPSVGSCWYNTRRAIPLPPRQRTTNATHPQRPTTHDPSIRRYNTNPAADIAHHKPNGNPRKSSASTRGSMKDHP